MMATYQNLQNPNDKLNRTSMQNADELIETIVGTAQKPGYIAELVFGNSKRLEFGVSLDACCAQISNMDDLPPYFVARSKTSNIAREPAFFLLQGSLTEILPEHQISQRELFEILQYFIDSGEPSSIVQWEAV